MASSLSALPFSSVAHKLTAFEPPPTHKDWGCLGAPVGKILPKSPNLNFLPSLCETQGALFVSTSALYPFIPGTLTMKLENGRNRKRMLILNVLPKWLSGKESACQCRRLRRHGFDPWVGKIPWRKKWQPILVFLPGTSHGQRSLVDYSPWHRKE